MRRTSLLLALLLAGCGKGTVPVDHTSASIDPGPDPGKPPRTLSMVWLHHSTGDSILQGGLLDALKGNAVAFHDINYKQAVVDGYVIGDHTDPPDFPRTFNEPKHLSVVKGWGLPAGKQHDIIMFKSCFPSSNIKDDAALEEYKKHYLSLLPTFKAHPDILFIAMSTPPLTRWETKPDRAARARTWSKWVTTEYAKDLRNVKVFDLFDALAIREGRDNANTLVPQFATARGDSHPSREGAQAVTRMFIPWFNRAVRAAKIADAPAAPPSRPTGAALLVGAPSVGALPADPPLLPASTADLMKQAQEAYVDGNYRRAIELCQQVLKLEPGHKQALMILGASACRLKDTTLAKWAYDRLPPGKMRESLAQICARVGVELK
jgi:hypothetical protein